MWGEVYRHLNPKGEQLLVTLGGIVLSVILYLVETCLPHAMAVAVFAAMQTGSVLCLWHARRLFEMQAHTWGARTRGPARRSPALLYVCIVVFSVPYNFLQAGDGMAGLLADAQAWAEVLSVTVVIMLAACLVECVAERRGVALMPLITLVLLGASMLVHLLEGMPPLLVPSLLYAGYYLFLAMVYLALGPIVATTDANPLRLFSGAMIANVAGLLVGSLLGGLLGSMGERAATMLVMGFAYGILFLGSPCGATARTASSASTPTTRGTTPSSTSHPCRAVPPRLARRRGRALAPMRGRAMAALRALAVVRLPPS